MVKGIGGSQKTVKGSVEFNIFSRFNLNVNFNISALVVDRITDSLPSVTVNTAAFSHIKNLPLADGEFAIPSNIDVLIGSSIFPHLLLPGIVHSKHRNIPPAIQTVLGFVVMGSVPTFNSESPNSALLNTAYTTSCCSVIHDRMDTLFQRFWELEEITAPPAQSADDLECEHYFRATTTRDDSGRYIVSLPFREDMFSLGDSFAAAHRRYLCLERKLEASPHFRFTYNEVIRTYIDKGYLSPVKSHQDDSLLPSYYIPHHGVLREDKVTTKLRVVLDASCKTTSGRSLNDILHSGANLQGDLFCILINFRLFKICISADCCQMFHQIVVREPDRRFQRILYRFSTDDPVTEYEFNRVCFGLRSSPFHALRVVHQLVEDEGDKFPAAAAVASSALYMDDIVSSVMTDEQAITISNELIALFKMAQFDLVKWTSNSSDVLAHIPDTHKTLSDKSFDNSTSHKILGLFWDKSNDSFRFEVITPDAICTKRAILSAVARLWDILGFVAPTILYAKLLIKELWLLKFDWDAQPPHHIIAAWRQFCLELPSLNRLRIPRHLGVVEDCQLNILGFADASERAYGGVVYLHIRVDNKYFVQLLCAKSKVSPVKIVSIARLELCAAVLLAKLLRKVADTIAPRYPVNKIYAFSDSKVALCWIHSSPHRWQTFVANRVVQIIDNVPADCFYHVAGSDNPADCLSRGLTPDKLVNHPLWYTGPSWVLSNPAEWPLVVNHDLSNEDIPEQRTVIHTFISNTSESLLYALSQRLSGYSKLLRTIVYIYKFIKRLPRNIVITSEDLDFAEIKLIRAVQEVYFAHEFNNLKNNKYCSSALNKLRPFIDKDDVIRVGGRLSSSAEDYCTKYPLLLPRRDHVIDILIDFYHKKHLHAGPELLMSLLRQKYWIQSARRLIRYRIHKCNACFKIKPRPTFPLMADLPSHRVTQVDKAFTHVGCDYAGPLQYTPIRGRGLKAAKHGYVFSRV
ncbi:uncharacterized protein LOC128202583 [Galleria mellonella]|uniref:Uncharacterized protein LOC128202583 n=1 Tax=Galleria mellonella TaxID=7137 RepID=A0ABM3N6Y3_GALME|nr:uncharacterized protein LOC128202583 [Galleria mellonella]